MSQPVVEQMSQPWRCQVLFIWPFSMHSIQYININHVVCMMMILLMKKRWFVFGGQERPCWFDKALKETGQKRLERTTGHCQSTDTLHIMKFSDFGKSQTQAVRDIKTPAPYPVNYPELGRKFKHRTAVKQTTTNHYHRCLHADDAKIFDVSMRHELRKWETANAILN